MHVATPFWAAFSSLCGPGELRAARHISRFSWWPPVARGQNGSGAARHIFHFLWPPPVATTQGTAASFSGLPQIFWWWWWWWWWGGVGVGGEGKNYCPFFMKTCTQIKESTHIILAFLGVLAKSWARAWADLRGLSQYE